MVLAGIKSSNHRPISQTVVHWGHASTFVSLVSSSSLTWLLVGGLKGFDGLLVRPVKFRSELWRARPFGLKISQKKTSPNLPCSTHRAPCSGRSHKPNYGSMDSSSLYTAAIEVKMDFGAKIVRREKNGILLTSCLRRKANQSPIRLVVPESLQMGWSNQQVTGSKPLLGKWKSEYHTDSYVHDVSNDNITLIKDNTV